MGVTPDVVVGASIGAVVGGCFAAGRLDTLEAFARSLTKRTRVRPDRRFLQRRRPDRRRPAARPARSSDWRPLRIEDLPIRFAGVATEIGAGHEIWLKRGSLVEAMRASYALPGVFEPVRIGGRWLFDGAIVNPVPVSVARALGAERVIALNISSDGVGPRHGDPGSDSVRGSAAARRTGERPPAASCALRGGRAAARFGRARTRRRPA